MGILFLYGCSDAGKDNKRDAQIHITQANSYINLGQYRAGFIELQNALKLAPKSSQAYILMSNALLDLGQSQSAISFLEHYPGNKKVSIALQLAKAQIARHKYRSALETLQAINKDDLDERQNLQLYLLEGNANAGLSNYSSAENAYKALLKIDATHVDGLNSFTQFYIKEHKWDLAATMLDITLTSAPENPDALILKAQLAINNGNLSNAEDLLGKALINLPNSDIMTIKRSQVLRLLAHVLSRQGRSNEAMVYSQLLDKTTPENRELQDKFREFSALYESKKLGEAEKILAEIHAENQSDVTGTLLGTLSYLKGDFENADQYLSTHADPEIASDTTKTLIAATKIRLDQPEQVIELLKEDVTPESSAQLQRLYIQALIKTDQIDQAARHLEIALQKYPADIDLGQLQIFVFLKQGHDKKALEKASYLSKKYPDQPSVWRTQIDTFFKTSNEKQAERYASSLLTRFPDRSAAVLISSSTSIILRKYQQAENQLEQLLKKQPNNEQALFLLAQSKLRQGDFSEASTYLKHLTDITPDNIEVLRTLVYTFNKSGKSNEIPSYIDQLNNAFPEASAPNTVLAEYMLAKGDLEQAQSTIEIALERDPKQRTAHKILSLIHYKKAVLAANNHDHDTARQLIISGMEHNSDNPSLLSLLARIEMSSHNNLEAQKIISQITENPKTKLLGFELQGDFFANQNNFNKARESYSSLWQTRKTDVVGSKLYHSIEKSSNDQSAANSFLDEWIKALPKSSQPLLIRAGNAQKNKQSTLAIRLYKKTLEISPNDVLALNNLAWLLFENKDKDAQTYAAQAYKLKPDNPAVMDTYGWLLVNFGDIESGVNILLAATEKAPESEEISSHYKQARQRLEDSRVIH